MGNFWCNTHKRAAYRCKNEGGIMLPCNVVDLTELGELVPMKATIQLEGQEPFEVEITEQALDDIRFKFNPSNLDKVAKLKSVAATYLSLMEQYVKENPAAGREFAVARIDFQKVSMMAVLAATKGL